MLNNELFEDKKDAEIARLKLIVDKYKAYDVQRKKYYAESMQRLGELETYFAELKEFKGSIKGGDANQQTLLKIIDVQRMRIAELNRIIQVHNIEERRSQDELRKVVSYDEMTRQNAHLSKRVKNMQSTIDELIYKLKSNKED